MLKKISINLLVITISIASLQASSQTKLNAKEFLRRVRLPFSESSWARISGEINHLNEDKNIYSWVKPVTMDMRFGKGKVQAKITINKKDTYWIDLKQRQDKTPDVKIEKPAKCAEKTLKELGISKNDLTFSFIYWQIERDYKIEKTNGHKCRLLEMIDPASKEKALVWFSQKYYFPLKIKWYKKGSNTPCRQLEFKGFHINKKDDTAFPKEMILTGEQGIWETTINLKKVDFKMTKKSPEPKDLLKSSDNKTTRQIPN